MYDHHFDQILTWILEKGRQDPDARATALCLARAIANFTDWRDVQVIKPIVPLLLLGFPEIVLPLVGQAIVSEPARAWLLEGVLGDGFSSDPEQNPPIPSLPEDVLFAWCHAYPDRVPAFAAAIVPVLTTHRVDTLDPSLHPVTVRLLDEFGDREDVLEAIGRNMHTFGWIGSITTYFALYEEPLSTLCDHAHRVLLGLLLHAGERASRLCLDGPDGHAIDIEHVVCRAEARLHRKFADCNSGAGGEVEIVVAPDQSARRLQVRVDDAARLALGRIRHAAPWHTNTGTPPATPPESRSGCRGTRSPPPEPPRPRR